MYLYCPIMSRNFQRMGQVSVSMFALACVVAMCSTIPVKAVVPLTCGSVIVQQDFDKYSGAYRCGMLSLCMGYVHAMSWMTRYSECRTYTTNDAGNDFPFSVWTRGIDRASVGESHLRIEHPKGVHSYPSVLL